MDWAVVIERNGEALRRVLVMLVAMVGSDTVLPRCVRRAVLRLLRPAEAAARRLVIVAARDVVVALPKRPREKIPAPVPTIVRNGRGTGIVMPRRMAARGSARPAPAALRLPLLDPLPRFVPGGRPFPAAFRHGVPRISFPGFAAPFPVVPRRPPSPDDPVDALRLRLRLQAIGRALDDLPAEVLRFARWRARRDAALAARRPGWSGRVEPLRGGRPYGIRRPGARRRPHEIDEVLANLHHFARDVLNRRDTS